MKRFLDSNNQKNQSWAWRFFALQAGVVALFCICLLIFYGRLVSLSAAYGGLVYLVSNMALILIVFSKRSTALQAHRILRLFSWGEMIKLVVFALCAYVALQAATVKIVPFCMAIVVAQSAIVWGARLIKK